MSFSFTFPHKPLLHKRIEDQWFDRSPKETHSTLTALEAAEEAYAQRLAKITTPEHPPIVIGRAQHQNSIHQQQIRAQQQQQQQQQQQGNRRSSTETDLHSHDPADDQSTVVNPRTQQAAMFWNRPRSRRSAGGDR